MSPRSSTQPPKRAHLPDHPEGAPALDLASDLNDQPQESGAQAKLDSPSQESAAQAKLDESVEKVQTEGIKVSRDVTPRPGVSPD